MIARAATTLAAGDWRYTPRQLYYATCAAAESPPPSPARAQFALAALLGLVALILLPVRPVALPMGCLAALALAFGVISLLTPRRRTGRLLAVSYAEFEAVLRSDTLPAGLVDEPAAGDSAAPSAATNAITVVCDTHANAAAVTANLGHLGAPSMRVITPDVVEVGGVTVVALHDASPRGCALPLHLVDAGARVVDAGLRPAWVDRDDVQVVEGAPARLPRDLSSLLTDDEADWLRSGRRVELAVLPPERLMRLVRDAVDRAVSLTSSTATGVAATLPAMP
jgi:hypothetical protein